jgi:hypothetical protein
MAKHELQQKYNIYLQNIYNNFTRHMEKRFIREQQALRVANKSQRKIDFC